MDTSTDTQKLLLRSEAKCYLAGAKMYTISLSDADAKASSDGVYCTPVRLSADVGSFLVELNNLSFIGLHQ